MTSTPNSEGLILSWYPPTLYKTPFFLEVTISGTTRCCLKQIVHNANLVLLITYSIDYYRKEQLKMRASSLKEKVFFYPVTFAQLDSTVRHGIGPGTSGFSCLPVGDAYENQAAAFYHDSETANNLFQSKFHFSNDIFSRHCCFH